MTLPLQSLQSSSPAVEFRRVDQRIWRACAGSSVQIPTVNSIVVYFPQGHIEHSTYPYLLHKFSPLVFSKPIILCRISTVDFLADSVTDEVFVMLGLLPIDSQSSDCLTAALYSNQSGIRFDWLGDEEEGQEDKIVSFAKVLTSSDANNGGAFSVPRFCADSIFPPLNYEADPPVQTLSIMDVHGTVWDFRHIYRGMPKRHLFTTGWSKFVNHKKLVGGDSVVFMRNSRGEMFMGVRRAVRSSCSLEEAMWGSLINGGMQVKVDDDSSGGDVFSRNGRGRVSEKAVMDSAELAARGMPFEVVYYPKAGWSNFVVRAEVVKEALGVGWSAGMRVKMALETDDSSKMTFLEGTVSVATGDSGPWQGSPWRMLQVAWDDPGVQNASRVSPWQVQYVASAPPHYTMFPPAKKFKYPQTSVSLNDGEGNYLFPQSGLHKSTLGHLNAPSLSYTFPVGMQGARQEPFSVPSFSNITSQNVLQMRIDNLSVNDMVPKLDSVSTELHMCSPHSDNVSPDSRCSMCSFGTEHDRHRGCSPPKVIVSSFQLFGRVIYPEQSSEDLLSDVGPITDDRRKADNEIGALNNRENISLTTPYTKILDGLDVQCPI